MSYSVQVTRSERDEMHGSPTEDGQNLGTIVARHGDWILNEDDQWPDEVERQCEPCLVRIPLYVVTLDFSRIGVTIAPFRPNQPIEGWAYATSLQIKAYYGLDRLPFTSGGLDDLMMAVHRKIEQEVWELGQWLQGNVFSVAISRESSHRPEHYHWGGFVGTDPARNGMLLAAPEYAHKEIRRQMKVLTEPV